MGEDLDNLKKQLEDCPVSAKASAGKQKKSIEEFEKELEDCQKISGEYLAGWQRSRADFLNYKKEEMERISEILKYGIEEMILKLLPVLDNFDVAEKKMPEDLKNNENTKGILQIKNQILDFFKSHGVEEIKTVGQKFDPALHEIVGEEETDAEEGMIVREVEGGYSKNGKILRVAKVVVGKRQ